MYRLCFQNCHFECDFKLKLEGSVFKNYSESETNQFSYQMFSLKILKLLTAFTVNLVLTNCFSQKWLWQKSCLRKLELTVKTLYYCEVIKFQIYIKSSML